MEERKTRPLPDKVEHWKQLREVDFLGWWDIPEEGSVKVTIESVQQEELFNTGNNKREWKNTLKFKGAKKSMVLNTTNMDLIASFHGNSPKSWPGKEIELIRSKTKLRGEPVDCIRVKGKNRSGKANESIK